MVLGHAAADLDNRRFLEGVGADDAGAHLAGNGQHGDAIELGVGNRGHQVCGPGAARGRADADLARAPRVPLRGKSAPLLVPRQNDAKLVAESREGLVQRNARTAGIGKNRIHPVVHQRLDDNIRPTNGGRRAGGWAGAFAGHDIRADRLDHCHTTICPRGGVKSQGNANCEKHSSLSPNAQKLKRIDLKGVLIAGDLLFGTANYDKIPGLKVRQPAPKVVRGLFSSAGSFYTANGSRTIYVVCSWR